MSSRPGLPAPRYLDANGRLFDRKAPIPPAAYVVTLVLKRVGNPGTTEGSATRPSSRRSRVNPYAE
jgi:hypothetical protein